MSRYIRLLVPLLLGATLFGQPKVDVKLTKTAIFNVDITEDASGKYKVGERLKVVYSQDGKTTGFANGTFDVDGIYPLLWSFTEVTQRADGEVAKASVSFTFSDEKPNGEGMRMFVQDGQFLVTKFNFSLVEGDAPTELKNTYNARLDEAIAQDAAETYESLMGKMGFSEEEKRAISMVDLEKLYWVASDDLKRIAIDQADREAVAMFNPLNGRSPEPAGDTSRFVGIASGRNIILSMVRSKKPPGFADSRDAESLKQRLERDYLTDPDDSLSDGGGFESFLMMRRALADSTIVDEGSLAVIRSKKAELERELRTRNYILKPLLDDADLERLNIALLQGDYTLHSFIASNFNSEPTPTQGKRWILPDDGLAFKYTAPSKVQAVSNLKRINASGNGLFNIVLPAAETKYGFWIATTPITRRQFSAVMGHDPSRYGKATAVPRQRLGRARYEAATLGSGGGSVRSIEEIYVNVQSFPDSPVESVTKAEAEKYCELLTERERSNKRLPVGYEYRLPTVEEWILVSRGTNVSVSGLKCIRIVPEVYGPVSLLGVDDKIGVAMDLSEHCLGHQLISLTSNNSPTADKNLVRGNEGNTAAADRNYNIKVTAAPGSNLGYDYDGIIVSQDILPTDARDDNLGFRVVLAQIVESK